MTRVAALALVFVLAGCSGDPVGSDASRIPALVLDGVMYSPAGELDGSDYERSQDVYGTVLRRVDCSGGVWLDENTHIDDACHLEDGDSDFLDAGTPVYAVEGESPRDWLAAEAEELEGPVWLLLRAGADREGDRWVSR